MTKKSDSQVPDVNWECAVYPLLDKQIHTYNVTHQVHNSIGIWASTMRWSNFMQSQSNSDDYSHLSIKRGGWNKRGGWDFLEKTST